MHPKTRSRARVGRLALAALSLLVLAAAPASAADGGAPLQGVVNVNTASVEELQLLPGVGETRARAIIDERKARGGFKSLSDLLEVRGIGEASLARLRPHVVLTGKTTAQP